MTKLLCFWGKPYNAEWVITRLGCAAGVMTAAMTIATVMAIMAK